MKNLELLAIKRNIDDVFDEAAHFSHTSEAVYFLKSSNIYKHDFENNITRKLCDKTFTNVTTLKALTIENKVCIIIDNTIQVLKADEFTEEHQIGLIAFEDKIEAISWNPIEEIVVIVFSNRNVSTYFLDLISFNYLCEDSSSIDAAVPETVYVGWGSKNTQFRGSEGKLKVGAVTNSTEIVKPISDQTSVISWRGNGEMFVVNYWKNQQRMFMVFELPCTPLYHSEEYPGLGTLIAWRPAGNMIATSAEANTNQEKNIVIFEKNGQKRFSFEFPLDNGEITEIKWSPCAQFLAIESELEGHVRNLTLMTVSNYKWYQKQNLRFDSVDNNTLLSFDWINTTQFTCTLRIVTRKEIVEYIFKTTIHLSNISSTCAVIDGKILHLTLFDNAIIPPPMSSLKNSNNNPINFIIFHPTNNLLLALVDSKNYLKIFKFGSGNYLEEQTSFDLNHKNNNNQIIAKIPLACHHFLWLNDNNIYFAVEIEGVDEGTITKTVIVCLNIETGVTNNLICSQDNLIIRHLISIPLSLCQEVGEEEDNNYCSEINLKKLTDDCLYMNSEVIDSTSAIYLSMKIVEGKVYLFYLTSSNYFYINDIKISSSVSSFLIFQDYLLLTLKENHLYCVRLTEFYLKRLLSDDENCLNTTKEFYYRSIEQGAIIVCGIQNTSNIILQMPRGNIEIISNRLIAIDILEELLNKNQWFNALNFIRTDKLNANLLIDLNPNRFINNINNFILATKTINLLNNICLEFEDTNILETIYKKCFPINKIIKFPNKCRIVFKKMLDYFEEIDYASFITTIVVIKLHFFNLKEALIYIQDLLMRSKNNEPNLKELALNAINTLKIYGCDEKLYDEALLLYDLDLAYFIAQSCQMDPRIYEPQLNKLKELTEIERRFQINLLMKKPSIAILYLLHCPNVLPEDVLAFIKQHQVFREAYEQCSKQSQHFAVISKAFAQYLDAKGKYFEARIVKKRANLLFVDDLSNYCKFDATNWKNIIDTMKLMNLNDNQKESLINDLALNLIKSNMIKDAAIVYEYYANNYEEAIKVLVKNCLFCDAIHIANKFNRQDILETDIIPAIINYSKYLKEKLNEMGNTFNKYKSRLFQVRAMKVAKFTRTVLEDTNENVLFSDVASIVSQSSTTRSSRSKFSTVSSKNRRKEERKKQDLKEGGFYEDIALIRALYNIIKEIYSKNDEIKTICYLLLQETDMSYGEIKELYQQFVDLITEVNENLVKIWPPHFYFKNPTEIPAEMADIDNIEHLDVVYRMPSVVEAVSFSLDLFK